MTCPNCGRSYSGLQSPACPHGSRPGFRVLRRILYLLAAVCMGVALLAPRNSPLLMGFLYAYPLLGSAILVHCLPGSWERQQDPFLKLLVGLGIAVVSGLGAFVLIFITCFAKVKQLGVW